MHSDINQTSIDHKIIQQRLTAVWALSESVLGGFLHAFKLPFTGLIVSSVAVLIISGMVRYGAKRGDILKSTLIVILAKVAISPNSPITAHFAVLLQGLLAGILFSITRNSFRTATIIFAIIVSFLSATQKIIVLTLLFGFSLWEAIDSFIKYVIDEVAPSLSVQIDFSFSQLVIIIYLSIHIIAGMFTGFFSLYILKNISEDYVIKKNISQTEMSATNHLKMKRKKKFWWKRLTGIILITILLTTAFYSYFNEADDSLYLTIAIILIRSFGLTIIWYFLIAPYAYKLLSIFFNKQKSNYSVEVSEILNLIPIFRMIVSESYLMTAGIKGLNRYKDFLIIVLSNIIFYKLKNVQD